MEKIKDFLHYISDLVLALIILSVISLSFYFNISCFFTNIFENNPIVFTSKITGNSAAQNKENENTAPISKEVSITIPENSISAQIVDILYDNQIIKSKEEGMDHIRANHLDGKLKSGKFKINTSLSTIEVFKILSM